LEQQALKAILVPQVSKAMPAQLAYRATSVLPEFKAILELLEPKAM
jgi:hypothetical protein